MTTPEQFKSSKYPEEFDSDDNLFLVHDALRVKLLEDYNPETDTSITVFGDTSKFPPTGIITLTEQCSDIENRAVSFYYTSRTETTFDGLILLDGFDNSIVKPKIATNVTQNVVASHHNSLKDCLIEIQKFVGKKGIVDDKPFGETLEGRINFLTKLVLSPRAFFSADKRVGLAPLEVNFKNESFRLGDGDVIFTWDFGDNDGIPSTICVSSITPVSVTDVNVVDTDGGEIIKTYLLPGNYDVKLTVENEHGTDVVQFDNFINVRIEAPDEAIIDFTPTSDQNYTAGSPVNGPYTSTPKIRSKTNKFIDMFIQGREEDPIEINPNTDRTFAGEVVDISGDPIDPIESYTWSLSDDLTHANQSYARAAYSIGGLYDLVLRCDTRYGSYRITTYENAIDVVEDQNLWMFTIEDGDTDAYANEFGLISETFKTGDTPYTVLRDSDFLNNTNNESKAKYEFNRNTAFAINGTINSGNKGNSVLVYSGGGIESSALIDQITRIVEFEGFSGVISDSLVEVNRPWNWIYFAFDEKSYFLFGPDVNAGSGENLSYTLKSVLNIGGTISLGPSTNLVNPTNFLNGASELLEHVTSSYDMSGEPLSGRFAVYRSAKKNETGYLLRNDGVGNFFKIKEFYRTEGTSAEPVINIRKLIDMDGQVKTEGELVNLTNGLFFFNNSGNISAYNTMDGVWESGNSTSPFKSVQDTTVSGYDNRSNTLRATSDDDRNAYISFDYSSSAFVKYNSIDKTFSSLGARPEGEQWALGIY